MDRVSSPVVKSLISFLGQETQPQTEDPEAADGFYELLLNLGGKSRLTEQNSWWQQPRSIPQFPRYPPPTNQRGSYMKPRPQPQVGDIPFRETSAGEGGAIDHSSREAFVATMMPYAIEAERATGIPAEIMLAININEQGWKKPAPGNNYFGIKGANPRTGATTGPVGTWEVYNGQPTQVQDSFRAYDSPAESYSDFGQFLKDNSRYAGALKLLADTGDGEAFIKAVHKAGYATDPNWSNQVISIARSIRRQRPSEAETAYLQQMSE